MILQAARLRLRPFTTADIPAYAAIRADPAVMRFMPGGAARAANPAADAARIIGAFAEGWARDGYAPWAVTDRAGGRLLGHGGLRLLPDLGGETEILYLLARSAWGQGLASEIATAARDLAFGPLGLHHLVGYAQAANIASCRALRRIGMTEQGEVTVFGLRALKFSLAAPPPGA